jgi:heme-degrading monooxygenase HmoA
MSKFLAHQLAAIATIVLSVSVLLGIPATAQAATVSLSDTSNVVNVVTVYSTIPETQSKLISEIAKGEKTLSSRLPNFQNFSVLKAQDGSPVIALSQWKNQDLSSVQSNESAYTVDVDTEQEPQTFACQVQHTEARGSSLSFQKGDVIMFSQFKMKPGKDQSELAMVVSQEMPAVLQMIPGLQWAAMCPSTDQSTIALLARWNSREDFESLGQQPGFDQETN